MFPSTDWPLVLSSREASSSRAFGPLSEFCGRYWSPVYAYLRRRGYRADEAEDLTQGFFTHLLTTRLLDRAMPERGRLRTLLLTCLTNYVANQRIRDHAQKRGGPQSQTVVSRADTYTAPEPADHVTPERIYELQWAIALLRRVLDELRAEFRASGKESLFKALEGYLINENASTTYSETAARLNVTEAAVRVTVHRLRRRYRELLRMEVARTLRGPQDDVASEIRYLLTVLQDRSCQRLES